ncbi:MAG: PEGA domain-containing protein [Planctomycetota bacterium]
MTDLPTPPDANPPSSASAPAAPASASGPATALTRSVGHPPPAPTPQSEPAPEPIEEAPEPIEEAPEPLAEAPEPLPEPAPAVTPAAHAAHAPPPAPAPTVAPFSATAPAATSAARPLGFVPPSAPQFPTPSGGPHPAPGLSSSTKMSLGLLALAAALLLGVYWVRHLSGGTGPATGPTAGVAAHPDVPGSTTPTGRPATLSIATTPPGAMVIVNDRILGASPVTTSSLAAGRYSVRCEMAGYQPAIAAADTDSGACSLNLTLQPVDYAALTVQSNPADAEITVDGEFRGRTPATIERLTPGPHQLVVKKENYSIFQTTVVLHAGEKKQLADVTLANTLLDMLKELVATDPRLISNHLDLAHYYYINNQMDAAAREYVRVNELAALPMEVLPDDATAAEKEEVRLNYEWDKSRVRSEEDKHLHRYRSYYANNLDFDTFLKKYKEYSEARWDIHNFEWVADEAARQEAAGNPGRAVELFSDAQVLDPKSVSATAGLAEAFAAAKDFHDSLAQATAAEAELKAKHLTAADDKQLVRVWHWLAETWRRLAAGGSGDERTGWLASAVKDLQNADNVQKQLGANADPYVAAWLLCDHARLAAVQGNSAQALAQMTAALDAARKNAAAEKAHDTDRHAADQCDIFALDFARIQWDAGKKADAIAGWKALLAGDGPAKAGARAALLENAPDQAPHETPAAKQ